MVGTLVEMDAVFWNGIFGQRFGFWLKDPAINKNFPFGPNKGDSATVAMDNFHAIGINVADALGRFRIFGWDDLDWSAFVHAQTPLRDIEVVGPPIGHHAA